jgi:hypothetical protein
MLWNMRLDFFEIKLVGDRAHDLSKTLKVIASCPIGTLLARLDFKNLINSS